MLNSTKSLLLFIAVILFETPRVWKIDYKTVEIVADNSANIFFAVHCSEWWKIPCYAHTQNLIVQTTIKVIKNRNKR
jgi:hypothetical protein